MLTLPRKPHGCSTGLSWHDRLPRRALGWAFAAARPHEPRELLLLCAVRLRQSPVLDLDPMLTGFGPPSRMAVHTPSDGEPSGWGIHHETVSSLQITGICVIWLKHTSAGHGCSDCRARLLKVAPACPSPSPARPLRASSVGQLLVVPGGVPGCWRGARRARAHKFIEGPSFPFVLFEW